MIDAKEYLPVLLNPVPIYQNYPNKHLPGDAAFSAYLMILQWISTWICLHHGMISIYPCVA